MEFTWVTKIYAMVTDQMIKITDIGDGENDNVGVTSWYG